MDELHTNSCLPAHRNADQRWEEGASSPSSRLRDAAESTGMTRGLSLRERFFRSWARQLWLWSCLIFFSIVSYCLCNQFIVTSVVIQGKSMLPTLREGEHYLLDRWTYHRRNPKRGELVVLRDPGHSDYAVKRVVALPGETIWLRDGKVFVNGALLPEPYLPRGLDTFLPDGPEKLILLGEDEYFVMGDNRLVSEDSRYYGPISRQLIAGHLAVK